MAGINAFIDEAGDFGFKKTSSKYFVVSYVVLEENLIEQFESEIGRTLAEVNRTMRKKISEFKFSKDDETRRKIFLDKINSLGIIAGVVAIKKEAIPAQLRKKTKDLYNLVLTEHPLVTIAKEYFHNEKNVNKIIFVFDRFLSKKRRITFNTYLGKRTNSLASQMNLKIVLRVRHEDSEKNNILQMADYVAGTVSYWLETGNDSYYKMIQKSLMRVDILNEKKDWLPFLA
jgi:hypothetical protein